MKRHLLSVLSIAVLVSGSALSASAEGENAEPKTFAHKSSKHHPRYRLVHIGTLGGPIGYGSVNGDGFRLLNHEGVVSSFADTTIPDPNAPNFCFESNCLVDHAFRWKRGIIRDLGALNNDFSSAPGSINAQGWSTGQSQTGQFDPVAGFPQIHATLWKHHHVVDLGTLDGGNESLGVYLNDLGQVVGFSDNGVPDPFALFPIGTQTRTFLWERGVLQDIGTLGGPDAVPSAGCDNQRHSFIVGGSYTGFTPNETTGVPTLDPFLWKPGTMINLGNLGGTVNFAQCANNRGEVIGMSNLPGDLNFHAFFWRKGKMKDLGTLGGSNSEAIWINDSGEIAGSADLPGDVLHDAVIWRKGKIHDLGTIGDDPCSRGRGINSRGQVVGGSSDCANFTHGFVWEEGGPMLDLNKLIAPDSGVRITNAININDRGEILAKSIPEDATPIDDLDQGHLVLLIPCERDDKHKGCETNDREDDSANEPIVALKNRRMPAATAKHPRTPKEAVEVWRLRLLRQYHLPPSNEK